MYYFNDIKAMTYRSWKLGFRSVDAIITALALPILILLAFVFIFGGAIDHTGQYIQYIVPGIIVMGVGQVASTTAVSLANSREKGILKRFKTMAINQTAVLYGEMNMTIFKVFCSLSVLLTTAYLLGFRSNFSGISFIQFAVILLLLTALISWIGFLIGLRASTDAASSFSFVLVFLPYLSSAFVDAETMPEFLQLIAKYSPFTWVTEAIRDAVYNQLSNQDFLFTCGFLGVMLLIFAFWTTARYRKKT
ncbi:ABC-2 type transporter [Enterococcus faecalis 13-SD-W-01]|nr:ABC-2 type transporter [Enterococcus faecalis 13-SD-W-01]